MDMDRAYVKKTQQQYHEKSPPMESIRTKEKRQAREHMEKGSGAGYEEGRYRMRHNQGFIQPPGGIIPLVFMQHP